MASSAASFHAAMAAAAAVTGRRRWARITARTGPKLEIAASCAASSVIPIASPAASGLAQVVLGLGHDQLRLVRRDPQPGAQFLQVPGDQVGGRPAHAGHSGSARAGPAADRRTACAGAPRMACIPPANLRHAVRWAASAAAPWSVSP